MADTMDTGLKFTSQNVAHGWLMPNQRFKTVLVAYAKYAQLIFGVITAIIIELVTKYTNVQTKNPPSAKKYHINLLFCTCFRLAQI